MKISASILNVEQDKLPTYLQILQENQIDFLHLDVMDGIFVPNETFNETFIEMIHPLTTIPFDTHLMIHLPERFVDKYINAKTDYLTFHVEATPNPEALINYITAQSTKVGISIKPNTLVESIINLLPLVDLVLVMSVEPGFGGQVFMESALDKIKELVKIREENHYNFLIEVDGGINLTTSNLVKEAGADIIVVGSYLAKSNNIEKTIKDLKNI